MASQGTFNLAFGETLMKKRWILEAAGAMLLFLLPFFWDLMIPGSLSLLHHVLPMKTLVEGIVLDMLGFFILGVVLLALLSRLSPLTYRMAAAALAGFVIWRATVIGFGFLRLWLENQSTAHLQMQQPSVLNWIAITPLKYSHQLLIAIPLFLIVIVFVRPSIASHTISFVRLGLAAFSFSLLWMVPQLLYFGFVLQANPSSGNSSVSKQSHSGERVVWILLDELSYNLVFDHPSAGQQFPNLQSLRSHSTSFGNIQAFGSYSDRIIPSILAGREIERIRATSDGSFSFVDQADNQWTPYDPKKTLFGLAQDNGWNPGVAGSEIPYCRIFRDELTACSWLSVPLPIEVWTPTENTSIRSSALAIPRAFIADFTLGTNGTKTRTIERTILGYRSILEKSKELIQDDRIRFVFLHIPVPHPPGIYNRNTHQLVVGGNYLDNLTLADDTLGTLLGEIEETASSDQTTIIVSSDHSWRIPIWRSDRDWTPEEENVSQGRFDKRPVFLVHFPNQNSGKDILSPVPELVEHDIVASILQGKMKSSEDLNAALISFSQTSVPSNVKSAH
jgi:hypothetical protein